MFGIKKKIAVIVSFVFVAILMVVISCGDDDVTPPGTPENPNPEDEATDVFVDADLSWECSNSGSSSYTYDIYFDTDPDPILVETELTETQYDPGIMNANTTYYWKVVAKSSGGGETGSSVWSFTTGENWSQDYFPHTDQSQWHYDDISDDSQQEDVVIKLNGTANHDSAGELQVLEIYFDTILTHTFYVNVDVNGVVVYFDLSETDNVVLLKYPLAVGNTWTFAYEDSVYIAEVITIEDVVVPAGIFNDCLRIDYYPYYEDYYDEEKEGTIWFHAETGMIQGYDLRDWWPIETYQLLDYNIQ